MSYLAKLQFTKQRNHSEHNRKHAVHPELFIMTLCFIMICTLPTSSNFISNNFPSLILVYEPFYFLPHLQIFPQIQLLLITPGLSYMSSPQKHPLTILHMVTQFQSLYQVLHSCHHSFKLSCPSLIFIGKFCEGWDLVILEHQSVFIAPRLRPRASTQ